MADKMYLVITVRKEVADRDEGREIFEWVKQKLSSRPDVILAGLVSNNFDLDQE